MLDFLIKNGTVFTPNGKENIDIGVSEGQISILEKSIPIESSKEVFNAKDLLVLPGVIDTQVHFREPGLEYKEDLETGMKSAIKGGVTAVFEMPNTNPCTSSKEALQDKLNRASGRASCDYAFFMGANSDKSIDWEELESLDGSSGIKIFMGSSTGSLLVSEDDAIYNILSQSKRRTAVHCEDEKRLKERFHIAENGKDPSFHPKWRDEVTAYKATERLLSIARKTGSKVHVLHVTTKEEMELLSKNKDICTVEVLPQHLTFTDEFYKEKGSLIQMNPPIRSIDHREALWKAINNGIVDVIGSDHAPHTLEEKSKPYPSTPSGMPGVQTLVPIMLNHVNEGRLSLERFVDLTSSGPSRIYNIMNRGRIVCGYEASFTVVDMNKEYVIKNEDMESKCGWTPYDSMKVKGYPYATILRGNIVMKEGKILDSSSGRPVKFY